MSIYIDIFDTFNTLIMESLEIGKRITFYYYSEYGRSILTGKIIGTDGNKVKVKVDDRFSALTEATINKKDII